MVAREPDQMAFSPYGSFLVPPAEVGGRALFSEWLEPQSGLSQQSHLNRVPASAFPAKVGVVERHPHAAQLFLPVGVSRYLVTVMPALDDGAPDTMNAMAFVVPGTMGVVYRPDTWHTGIVALDSEASFAVFMQRGTADDDVFVSIDPMEIREAADGHGAHGGTYA